MSGRKDFKKKYQKHLKEIQKDHPEVTMIGADGSPRRDRDHKQFVYVVTLAERRREGFAIVGIYAHEADAKFKADEIKERIVRGEHDPLIVGVEEYPIEQFVTPHLSNTN
jgi:hypothetical protein